MKSIKEVKAEMSAHNAPEWSNLWSFTFVSLLCLCIAFFSAKDCYQGRDTYLGMAFLYGGLTLCMGGAAIYHWKMFFKRLFAKT